MEFKVKIMVKIATDDGATTIIDGTMTIVGTMTIAQIVIEITIGGGEFRGLTNAVEPGKGEAKVLGELPIGISPTAPRFFLPCSRD